MQEADIFNALREIHAWFSVKIKKAYLFFDPPTVILFRWTIGFEATVLGPGKESADVDLNLRSMSASFVIETMLDTRKEGSMDSWTSWHQEKIEAQKKA